ncbi:MAG: endonuclease/exonuclease/phosphatase family protein [Pirellulales bacterium]
MHVHPLVRVLAALAAILVSISTQATAAEAEPLRVMTFNIRYDNPQDGEDIWVNRKDKVASMVRLYDADIVGMQEAQRNQIDDLAKRLPKYEWFGVGRQDGKDAGEFTPIFYRRDRLELLDQKTFWLSPTPDQAGSRGWDAALPRIATWARFRPRAGSEGEKMEFIVFNTHFDHMGLLARLESAKLLRAKVAEIAGDHPVVVIGDFNCLPGSPPYQWLIGKEPPPPATEGANVKTEKAPIPPKEAVPAPGALADAMLHTRHPHHGPTTTWNGFKALVPGRKIDHIFFRGPITIEQHVILADHWDGRFPSDHLPVMAEITVTETMNGER